MDSGQGMVAVVRGLGDSQLAVTLLDSGKQYTLLPTSALQPSNQQNDRSSSTNTPYQQYHQSQCHVGAQATDGQYATVYKTTHCKVRPTSPPIQLTEFPPQRAAVAPGEGNFEVGGTGSGDTSSYGFLRTNGAYRGGMVWPDRGCVCTPRASREPDAFADSLRKYPATMSPERSAEIVERLINYTQGKNFAKVVRQSTLSPTRLSTEINDRSPSRGSSRCKACDLEKTRYRIQGESPTKERQRKTERLDSDGESRKTFTKSFDVRYMKDVSRKFKEGMRNNPYTAQCPSIREAFEMMKDHAAANQKSSHGGHLMAASGNVSMAPLMVNSQTQAAASMACKEVSTESRHKMLSRNMAVPLSPSSDASRPPEGAVFDPRPPLLQASVQTLVIPPPVTVRKSVQTTQSSIDISNVKTSQNTKKCRSEIELSNREVREEILGWLIDVLHSTYSKKLRADVIEEVKEKMKIVSSDFGGEEAKVTLKVESVDDDCCKDNLEDICDKLVNKVRIKNRYLTQIYRAEVVPFRAPEDLKKAIKDWLLELPMRTRDYCGKYVDEEQMLANFVKRLKKALFSPDYDTKKLRNEIVKILQDIPIDYGSTNQNLYLNRLANNLIKKLLNANGYFNKNKTSKSEVENKITKQKFRPNENEIRDLVRDEMIEFLDKFDIKINLERLQDLETDILEKIMEFLNNTRPNNDERLIDDVARAVRSIGAFQHQALYLAHIILDHFKELLTKVERNERDQARRLHMMTVLNSTVNDTSDNTKRVSEKNKQNNLDDYIQQLTQQIDEWLAGLELEIPWSQDESFRQVVVNDLAEDIVDRHKYVQLNSNVGGTEKDELEYLKYLIFKWINKLVGEEHQETIEHAHELLRRIRNIPVPLLANVNFNCQNNSKRSNLESSLPIGYSASKNFQAFPVPIAGPSRIENPAVPALAGVAPANMGQFLENIRVPTAPAIKNMQTLEYLNNMYDDFVRKWVQCVPIVAYTEEEKALAETMRVGLYNGVFQIVTKLRFQPQLLFNPFFYQDALGEELEELLSMLPQTPEFLKHKNQLKVLMIEKTTELNEVIKLISSPDTFKEKIIHKYRDYVPRLSTNLVKECPLRLYEELQILNIAEDYLLFKKYNEEDPLKAYKYRQKLIERIEELVTEMKNVHGTELKNINPEIYMNEVLNALEQVSIPSEEEMKAEAEEILLGRAIEEWYMGLPLTHNDNLFEQLKRRHLRNALTKKIQNMEKSLIASGNTPEYELRHEISRFLEQIPLGKDETVNINTMVEALVNKVKDIVTPNSQVQALYNTSVNYSDFGENAALHSTTMQVPEGYRLVGPLPPCCAAGLDKILAQPGPSGLQIQTAGASSAGNNLTPELDRRASMIGGGPPLASQSLGQQSAGGLRQISSPVEEKRQSVAVTPSPAETSQAAQGKALKTQNVMKKSGVKGQQNTDDALKTVAGIGLATDTEKTQRRTSLQTQAGQVTNHRRPSIGESSHNSGSPSGQRRPSMGESEYKAQYKNIEEGCNIQILHVSDSASGHRKPSMDKLDYNRHNTGENSHAGSVRGQRRPSMGILGKNTQSESTQKQTTTKDATKRDGQRQNSRDILRNDTDTKRAQKEISMKTSKFSEQQQTSTDNLGYNMQSQNTQNQTNDFNYGTEQRRTSRDKIGNNIEFQKSQNLNKDPSTKELRDRHHQFSEQTVECSTCKVSSPSACKSPSQTKLCYCNKANTEKDTSGENKCSCAKPIRLCSNTETMTETKTCLCKGNKICLCKKTLASVDIGGQTSGQAALNMGGQAVLGAYGQGRYFQQQDLGNRDGQSTLDYTEYSVSGKPGQGRYLQEQQPGTEYGYDGQMTQQSNTLTNDRSLAQAQGLYTQDNIQYDQTQIRGHVPGPTRNVTQDAQMAPGAVMESDGGTAPSMGEQYEREKNHRPSALAQPGTRRLSHRVSIMSPQSQERLRLLSEADITSTGQQDPRGAGNLNEDVGTYGVFEGGRPRSSSLRETTLADPATIEQGRNYLQSQVNNSMPSRRSSGVPIQQSSPVQNFDPRLVSHLPTGLNSTTLSNISTPHWITMAQGGAEAGQQMPLSGMDEGYPVATNPCVCPPYVSMLSSEQLSMLSPQRTGFNPYNFFTPAHSPGQMFTPWARISGGESPASRFFGPNGTLPSPGQFRQVPQEESQWISMSQPFQSGMSQLRDSSMGQPLQSGVNQLRGSGMGQPLQSGMSQERQSSIGQPLQSGMRQPLQSGMGQPLQSGMSQVRQSGMGQPLQSGMSQVRQSSMGQPLQSGMSQVRQGSMGQPSQSGMSQVRQGSMGQPSQSGMSQVRQGSMGQPSQSGVSQVRQGSMGQPLQSGMSQVRQSGMGQPLQSGMSQVRQSGMGQPLQSGMSQVRQSGMGQPLQSGMSSPRQGGIGQPQQTGLSQPSGISQPRQVNVSQPLQGRVQQSMTPPSSFHDSRYSRYIPSGTLGAVSRDFPQDSSPYSIQASKDESSALMQTIPPDHQIAQTGIARQLSMPNRSQNIQDNLMDGGQSDIVQRIQEQDRRSVIEGNIQSTQEENNASGRTSRASMQATFSENVQSRSRQESIQRASPEQVGELAQLRAAQDRMMSQSGAEGIQRRELHGMSLIPTIEENEPQNISVQTGTQRGSWQIPRQNVTPLHVSQDGNILIMEPIETGMSQAQAIRGANQNPANHSVRWQSFGPEITPQNAQNGMYQEIIQPDTRISPASQSTVNVPIALNYPSISADQAAFQQAGPSPAIENLVEQIPVGTQGPSIMYSPGPQSYQNEMLMAGYTPGQPVQVVQDPAYIQPTAFSTPQRPIPPGVPRRAVKRGKRRHPRRDDGSSDSEQRGKNVGGEGRLESDSDSDHGVRIRCRCYDRLRRFKRRNEMYEEECDIPCPYAHYYYSCF